MRGSIDKILRYNTLKTKDVTGLIHEHIDQSYDGYIPVTGREGKGKSHLSAKMMLDYLRIPLDSPRALEAMSTNIRYSEDCNALKALEFYVNEAEDKQAYVWDEAERMASKYDSNTLEARVIRKYWTISRKRGIVSFMNLPQLANFDIYMRSGRAFIALNVVARIKAEGIALAVVLIGDTDSTDAFDLKTYYKNKSRKYTRLITPDDRIKRWAKCSSFAGILAYTPLPKKLEEKYLELSMARQQYKSLLDDLQRESIYARVFGKQGRQGGISYV